MVRCAGLVANDRSARLRGETAGSRVGADEGCNVRASTRWRTVAAPTLILLGAGVWFGRGFFLLHGLGIVSRIVDPIGPPRPVAWQPGPAVWQWVARLWNVRDTHCAGVAPRSVPGDLAALFAEISRNALPALAANAEAFARARSRHTIEIDGTPLDVPTSRYRVLYLERLSAARAALDESERAAAQALLADGPGWDILTQPLERTSGRDPDDEAPFAKGHLVYTRG